MTARLPAPTSVTMAYTRGDYEAPSNEPTLVIETCVDCGYEFEQVLNTTAHPDEPDEAWKLKTCVGTEDVLIWRWCRHLGRLRLPEKGMSIYFDRTEMSRC